MHYKTCEICGLRSGRVRDQKRTFMAKFPLDGERCKKWVKVTGKEDLACVPIEKLHELKYICGKHFRDRDFKKKKTQLKRNAVPSVLITAEPLHEILVNFIFYLIISQSHEIILQTLNACVLCSVPITEIKNSRKRPCSQEPSMSAARPSTVTAKKEKREHRPKPSTSAAEPSASTVKTEKPKPSTSTAKLPTMSPRKIKLIKKWKKKN